MKFRIQMAVFLERHRMPSWVRFSLLSLAAQIYMIAPAANAVDSLPTEPPASVQPATAESQPNPASKTLYVQEYRVRGTKQLPPAAVEAAVYPFLGPGRTVQDIESARAALEKAFLDAGFQTVTVQIPKQSAQNGIIVFEVIEAPIGRIRVEGARYFSIDAIRKKVPSLAPGKVPNFNDVAREMVALNQNPDRRVTPSLHEGVTPGTWDIDLKVEDKLPLHGSLGINNRYSANTTPLRLNGSLNYNNLWQLGHSIGGSFQIAPERLSDAVIYSGYYIARVPQIDWLGLMLQGTRQNSNVSTLGSGAVVGNGEIVGLHALIALPPGENYFHSLNLGIDYKHMEQDISVGNELTGSPVTYFPVSLFYSAAHIGKKSSTEFTGGFTFSVRGALNEEQDAQFDSRRFNADAAFLYFRGELAHTRELYWGFQIFGKIQGQASSKALVDSEEFAGGGLDTVRGYLEGEVLGDNAFFGTVEFRTPNLGGWAKINEWRIYGFFDGGFVSIIDPLPEQVSQFNLASIGVGTRIKIWDHWNGSLDLGVPMISQSPTLAGSYLATFELSADF